MSYTITTTAGVTLATITDGTVNTTTTSLTLIGKNYAGYGIFLNENYVKLLENFANGIAPSAPLTGQLWYDSSASVLKIYSGTTWKSISSSSTSATQPSNPIVGDIWWDSVNGQLKVWSGAVWVTVGPASTSTSGTSGAIVETILDNIAGSHVVVKFYISNTVVAIISKDTAFTPQTSIPGFTTIKPGMNLISSATLAGSQFTGDTSNALSLGGISSSQFLRSDQNTSTVYSITAGGGLNVGSDLTVTSLGTVTFTNVTNNADMNFWVNKGGVNTRAIGITGSSGNITLGGPTTVSSTLGTSGNVTVGSALNVSGISVYSSTLFPTAPGTVNIGSNTNQFANVYATYFNGTAIQATYADLAERFEADQEYAPGTVVELGGLKEITAALTELSESVFGVISTNAGFLMNNSVGNNSTHPVVAAAGRVPVQVVGIIHKGDRLVSAGNGRARAASRNELTPFNVIGRALENKLTTGEGIVEAAVRISN